MLHTCISTLDQEVNELIKAETYRQKSTINLIASENYTPISVLQANASVFTNKYSEGYPSRRYYSGTEIIDKIELLCQRRALDLFNLDPNIWGVNVQALSGSPANFAVYTGIVGPNGKIMGMDLPSGGHLSHGYKRNAKKISATSMFFESESYTLGDDDLLDYNQIRNKFNVFQPDILICGASAYPRDFDYKELKNICGEKYLMADIAHTSGLIACGFLNSPFDYCDIVTTTTHKTLRGPRGALIFFRKSKKIDDNVVNVEEKINFAVFPCLQGGPHNQTIAAIAVALKLAKSDEYKQYIRQVINNTQVMCDVLQGYGFKIISGGTDCHYILIDISGYMLGNYAEIICSQVGIIINKNSTPKCDSPFKPKGVRLGASAMTTRGLKELDFRLIAEFFNKVMLIGKEIKENIGDNIEDFKQKCIESKQLIKIKEEVTKFACNFEFPDYEYQLKR